MSRYVADINTRVDALLEDLREKHAWSSYRRLQSPVVPRQGHDLVVDRLALWGRYPAMDRRVRQYMERQVHSLRS